MAALRRRGVERARRTASASTSACSPGSSALRATSDGALCLRRPLSGVTSLEMRPGTVAFDLHADRHDDLRRLQQRRHLAQQRAEPAERLHRPRLQRRPPRRSSPTRSGCCSASLLIVGVYRLGISRRAQRQRALRPPRPDAHVRAHARADRLRLRAGPLLLAAALAGRRRSVYLASDPLGNGANLFGTAGYQIDYHVISYAAIWYVQVAALLPATSAG